MKKTVLVLLLCLTATFAHARKFYFSSSTGNDTYTPAQAQSQSTPWQTTAKISYVTTTRGGTLYPGFQFQAGDTLAFKRGDVFANGLNTTSFYRSIMWWYDGSYYVAPSGTPTNPIVFTNYGDPNLPLPNFLFPSPANASILGRDRGVFGFQDVHDIIVDGLQFNDYRFSVTDKVGTALTSYGIDITQSSTAPYNITIKNCYFNNIAYAIGAIGDRITITNNTITNLKSSGDTTGTYDIGAVPLTLTGNYHRITNNFIKGGWCFTGATASGQGLNGTGIEVIAPFDSSFIAYNTIVDCAGGVEFGNLTGNTSLGAVNDTFAYNKFINVGTWMYAPTNPVSFGYGIYRKIRVWNNVYVFNQRSRQGGGPRFGLDIYGDGQSFSQFPSWNNGGGILPNSYPYSYSRNLSEYNSWWALKYNLDNGTTTDTVYDVRNNVFWVTAGVQVLPPNSYVNTKRRNNIYHIMGTDYYATKLGPTGVTLGTGEKIINTLLFKDTTAAFAENWDFHLVDTSSAVGAGSSVGLTKDFAGFPVSGTPDIGVYKYSSKPMLVASSITNVTCKTATNGSVTVTASGGTGPYTYKMNNGLYQSSATFSNLAPGTYTITVKDSKGATTSITVTIKGSNVVC